MSKRDQSTADTAESLERFRVRQAGLFCMVDAWLTVLASSAIGRSRAYETGSLATRAEGWDRGRWKLTVGCKAKPLVLAFTQRDAIEAGLVAAGSGFTIAAARTWRLRRRAAALLAPRCGGPGSVAVVLLDRLINYSVGKPGLVGALVGYRLRVVAAAVAIVLHRSEGGGFGVGLVGRS